MGNSRVPGPLGGGKRSSKPSKGAPGPTRVKQPAIPNVTEPYMYDGVFQFVIEGPTRFAGGNALVGGLNFDMQPACTIRGLFNGRILLPPGSWEIGLVQNLLQDSQTDVYDKGGLIQFATGFIRLWDAPAQQELEPGAVRDIFYSTANVVNHVVTGETSQMRNIEIEWHDQPSNPDFPRTRTRCKDTITEEFVSFERYLLFVAAVLARSSDGVVFPVYATSEGYGFHCLLERSEGFIGPDWVEFRAIVPSRTSTERPPFKKAARDLSTKPPTAKEYASNARGHAKQRYFHDCSVKPAPKPDA